MGFSFSNLKKTMAASTCSINPGKSPLSGRSSRRAACTDQKDEQGGARTAHRYFGFEEPQMPRYVARMTYPKAIIFDLDGTLIHSAPDLHAAANATLTSLGREALDLPTVISFIGNGVEKLVERSLDATGGYDAAQRQTALGLFMDSYNQDMTTLTRPYPGVMAALAAFQDAGVPLGICTNKPTGPAREICERLDLTPYFQVIAGAEDGQAKKPDPAPLLACIDDLRAKPSETLYVGDSTIDYFTARNADVPFRLYTNGYLNAPLPDLPEASRFDDWTAHGIPTG